MSRRVENVSDNIYGVGQSGTWFIETHCESFVSVKT